ncbi:MAG: MarR family transcriptional regulator [Geobacteraceae bacterium]|nr:MarR family transcriptional regulator [Geobacteraceae bacterium]
MTASAISKSNEAAACHYTLDHRKELIIEIFVWLYGLSNVIDEQAREMEKQIGLSKNMVLAIKAVSRSPSARVTDLAKSMCLNPATMVRILDQLEDKGFVVRVRSRDDRRVVKILPTLKAMDIGVILNEIKHRSMVRCSVTANDEELMSALDALKKLAFLLDSAYLHPAALSDAQ